MPKIFISYRRAESESIAGRMYDHLERAFGAQSLFKDVFDIPPGRDFRDVIGQRIAWCDILLVVIGPHYATITDEEGNRRLFNQNDSVRFEVAQALLDEDVLVIPVLVNGARMPRADELPPELAQLSYLNGVPVRNDPDFKNDLARLTAYLRGVQQVTAPTVPTPVPEKRTAAATNPTPDPATAAPSANRQRIVVAVGGVVTVVVVALVLALSGVLDEPSRDPTATDPLAENPTTAATAFDDGTAPTDGTELKSYVVTYGLPTQKVEDVVQTGDSGDFEVAASLLFPQEWAVADAVDGQVAIAVSTDDNWVTTAAREGLSADFLPTGDTYYGLRLQFYPTLGLDHQPTVYYDQRYPAWSQMPGREQNYGEPHEVTLADGTSAFAFTSYDPDTGDEWRSWYFLQNGVGVLLDAVSNDHIAYADDYLLIVESLRVEATFVGGSEPLTDTLDYPLSDGNRLTMDYPAGWRSGPDLEGQRAQLVASNTVLLEIALFSLDELRTHLAFSPDDHPGAVFFIDAGTLDELEMTDASLEGMRYSSFIPSDNAPFTRLALQNPSIESVYFRRARVYDALFELHFLVAFDDGYGAIIKAFSNNDVIQDAETFKAMIESIAVAQ